VQAISWHSASNKTGKHAIWNTVAEFAGLASACYVVICIQRYGAIDR